MRIEESGMLFGEFDEANCFHIEESKIYNHVKGKGYKSVEFVLRRPEQNELLFVEAKPDLPVVSNIKQFDKKIAEISQKFMDSLHLAIGIWFGEHNAKAVVPTGRDSFFTYGTQIVFVLVVKDRKVHLLFTTERIRRELKREITLMRFKVLVLSEEDAIKLNLVIRDVGE
jgi:hypothetical protein